MKRDWDERARRNAKWFINTVKAEQSDEEFDELGRLEVEGLIGADLRFLTRGRDPQRLRALEIGCGLGRMTRALARLFGEVEATDVSGEMIRRARERLRDLPNVTLHETSGLDCRALPAESFDLIFSVYVFQHVPDVAAIRSNLVDAYRVLRPGGVFKFQTMDFTGEEFARLPKDTWAGAAFTEPQLRALARELGAHLLEITGRGSQYCWTTLTKPAGRRRRSAAPCPPPRLVAVGRWDDRSSRVVPASGDGARLSIVATGARVGELDANSLAVVVGGREVAPDYVGPVGRRWSSELQPTEIEVRSSLPPGLPLGPASVALSCAGGVSEAGEIEVVAGAPPRLWIPAVQNAVDGGLDVHRRGPKSLACVVLEGAEPTLALAEVCIEIDGVAIAARDVAPIVGKGGHVIQVQLPDGLALGSRTLAVTVQGRRSETYVLDLREPEGFAPTANRPATLRELATRRGDAAAIRAQGLFDAAGHRERAARSGAAADALADYLEYGGETRGDPHPLLSNRYYLERYPDVAAAGVEPLLHYVRTGGAEGRDPHPLFHTAWYLRQCGGQLPAGLTPLGHFLVVGARLGLDPHPLFDTRFYLRQCPEIAGTRTNPLVHYLAEGGRAGLDPHPLFSTAHYRELSGGNLPEDVSPLEAYLRAEPSSSSADPHPLFCHRSYTTQNPDVAANRVNSLLHFVFSGAREGRAPHPLFDVRLYRQRCGGRLPPGANPLVHFLELGERAGISPHPALDDIVGRDGEGVTPPMWLHGVGGSAPSADTWVRTMNLLRPLPVSRTEPRPPDVSVVFPVADDPATVLPALGSLRWHRNRCRLELVLVVAPGSPLVEKVLSRLAGAHLVERQGDGPPAARLATELRGRWVVFHDGTSAVEHGWLDRLVARSEGGVGRDAAPVAGPHSVAFRALPRERLGDGSIGD